MPYHPGVAFNPGLLYQGIATLGEGIASGMVARRKKEEEKKKKEEALKFARQILPSVNPDMAAAPDKMLEAGIEAVGIDNVLNLASNITQAAQQKQAADLKRQEIEQAIEQRRQEMAAAERNRAALSAAADPNAGLAEQILSGARFDQLDPNRQANPGMTYLRRGGDDPRHLNELNDLAAGMAKGNRPGPGLHNFGTDASGRPVEALVDAQGNARYIEPPKSAKEELVPLEIGGRKLFVGPGNRYFDDQGAPLAFPGNIDPETMALIGAFVAGGREGKPAVAAEIPTVTPEEAAKLPKGTRFKTTDGRVLVKN